jgi:hypothetical protein
MGPALLPPLPDRTGMSFGDGPACRNGACIAVDGEQTRPRFPIPDRMQLSTWQDLPP